MSRSCPGGRVRGGLRPGRVSRGGVASGLVVAGLLLGVVSSPWAGSAPSLRDRIRVDGRLDEYSADEWVVGQGTSIPESGNDSRSLTGEEIRRLALTWDREYLYLAVDCTPGRASPMVLLDLSCEGMSDLGTVGSLVGAELVGIEPNALIVGQIDDKLLLSPCRGGLHRSPPGSYRFALAQGQGMGMEAALPWNLLREEGAMGWKPTGAMYALVLLAEDGIVDAAPDPSGPLQSWGRTSVLDNFVIVVIDADGDNYPDVGVSPRDVSSPARPLPSGPREQPVVGLSLDRRAFHPERGEVLTIKASLPTRSSGLLFLTCCVYSADGLPIRTLLDTTTGGGGGVEVVWDGRDAEGNLVPGGIYLVAFGSGPGKDSARFAREAVVVIR